ncbi:MAG: hypothetical protein ACRDS9_08320 [Pseudonocardiaceae bacterium]
MTADLSREHWIVPVHGLTHADPNGIVQAIARPDGTVILHLTRGDSRTEAHHPEIPSRAIGAGLLPCIRAPRWMLTKRA